MFEMDKIAFVGEVSDVVMYVSLTAGLLIFVIGYFAGARDSLTKIFVCTLIVTALGTVALRVPLAVHDFFISEKSKTTQPVTTAPPASTPAPGPKTSLKEEGEKFGNFILYVIWTGFLVGMGIFLYESMTVTAHEARPD